MKFYAAVLFGALSAACAARDPDLVGHPIIKDEKFRPATAGSRVRTACSVSRS